MRQMRTNKGVSATYPRSVALKNRGCATTPLSHLADLVAANNIWLSGSKRFRRCARIALAVGPRGPALDHRGIR
jgi:hypothetical protein